MGKTTSSRYPKIALTTSTPKMEQPDLQTGHEFVFQIQSFRPQHVFLGVVHLKDYHGS